MFGILFITWFKLPPRLKYFLATSILIFSEYSPKTILNLKSKVRMLDTFIK